MIPEWSQTVPKHMLMPVDPLLAHFGRFPPSFLGPTRPFGGPKWAQNDQNLDIFPIFSFDWKCTKMVSKLPQTVPKHIFYAMLTPFWSILAGSPYILWLPRPFGGPKWAQNGPKKGPKNGPKWSKSLNFSDFQFRLEMH